MLLAKKALARRNFLRGAGITIGLPLLDAMVPVLTAATLTDVDRTVRLGFIYAPNGVAQQAWLPSKTGVNFDLPRVMKPLASFRDRVLVLSNLMQNSGRAIGDGAGDHSRASATWLTGVAPKRTLGSDVEVAMSADQIAAQQLGNATRLRSLELGIERVALAPEGDSGYNSIYANTISWKDATVPNLPESNPRLIFERLFGKASSSIALKAATRRGSILDLVHVDTARLRKNLGPRDKTRLDDHMARVRDLEWRVQGIGAAGPESYEQHAMLMADLMAVAFQTDSTRVASLMLGRERSQLTYRSLGISDAHHSVTHHRNDAEKLAKVARINELHVSMFAHLLRTLDAMPEGNGTVLDHTLLLFGSSLGDGDRHTHDDLPLLLAGGTTCKVRGGKHLRYAPATPMNNLLVAMLAKAGVERETLGDSTGALDLHEAA